LARSYIFTNEFKKIKGKGKRKMKNHYKIIFALAGVLLWSIAANCGAAAYYNTIEQPSAPSMQIKTGTDFNVRAIDFSAIVPTELGYAKAEEWNADSKDVPQVFADAFPVLLKEGKIENKKVNVIARDEPINKGIVVDVAVTKIILKWSFMRPRPDEFICQVTFTNAADGQKLFSGIVNVNSMSGNPYAQIFGGGFGGRLQTAAYNVAWVLTKIMVQGRIEPADY
jgi:hypothetical protein